MVKQTHIRLSIFLLILCSAFTFPAYVSANGCTPDEVQRIISSSNRMITYMYQGNYDLLLRESAGLQNSLSPSCQAALVQAQRANPYGGGVSPYGGGVRPYRPPSVIDHGNGLYSVPGVGACDSNGCIAY